MSNRSPQHHAVRRADLFCLAAFLVLSALFTAPSLFGGKAFVSADLMVYKLPWRLELAPLPDRVLNPAVTDGIQTFYPWRDFLHRELIQGRVPLWNPYAFCGAPFAANDASAVYYPFNFLLFGALPTASALATGAALHLFLAGLSGFLALRALRLTRPAAFLGGALFMFNGWFAVWMQMPVFHQTGVWLPLILLSVELTVRDGGLRPRGPFIGLAAWGMQFLAGLLQVSLYIALFAAAYGAFRIAATLPRDPSRAARVRGLAVWAAAAGAGGLAIGWIQVGKTLALSAVSHRASADLASAVASAFPVHRLIALIFPDFFGNPAEGTNLFNPGLTVEMTGHAGAAALLFALAAAGRKKSPAFAFFGAMAVGSLLLATGSPLYSAFHALVPGAGLIRPNRLLFLTASSLAMLGACGFDAVLRGATLPGHRLRAALAWLAGAAAVVWAFHTGLERLLTEKNMPFDVWLGRFAPMLVYPTLAAATLLTLFLALQKRISPAFFAAATILLAAGEPFLWACRFNPQAERRFLFPETTTVEFLKENAGLDRIYSPEPILQPSLGMPFGLYDVRGYDSLYPRRYQDLFAAMQEAVSPRPFLRYNQLESEVVWHPILDMMGVKYALLRERAGEAPEFYRPVHAGGVGVFENLRALPRALVLGDWIVEENPEKALDLMALGKVDFRTQAVLEREPNGATRTPGRSFAAEVAAYRPDFVEIRTDTPDGGLLFLSDQYDGELWRAEVDGRPAETLKANVAFRAVAVEGGRKTVRFVLKGERPFTVFLSLAVPALLFAGLGLAMRRMK